MAGRYRDLSANARLVMFTMALNARDTGTEHEPARTYFRGWEHLAQVALARDGYDATIERAVNRAVRELVDAGAIKVVGRRHGTRHGLAMYELVDL